MNWNNNRKKFCFFPSLIQRMLLVSFVVCSLSSLSGKQNLKTLKRNQSKWEHEWLTCLSKVNWPVSSSCLHQQLVRQDTSIGSIPVIVEGDAASLPVLIESLLETYEKTQSRPFFILTRLCKFSSKGTTVKPNINFIINVMNMITPQNKDSKA